MTSKKDKVFTTAQVADALGAELVGSGSVEITGVSSMAQAGPGQLSFITSQKYAGKVNESKAAAFKSGSANNEPVVFTVARSASSL